MKRPYIVVARVSAAIMAESEHEAERIAEELLRRACPRAYYLPSVEVLDAHRGYRDAKPEDATPLG